MDVAAPSEVDHGRARSSRLISGVLTSIGARALTSLSPLLLIPVTYTYLGTERYGIWMAVVSLTSMFLWADLGLGNALMTRLTPLLAHDQLVDARALVSDTYRLLAGVAVIGLALLAIAYPVLPWDSLFNASTSADAAAISAVCIAAFIANIPLALIHRILFAQQRVPASNLVNVIGATLALALGATAVAADAAPLVVIAVVVAAPVATNAAATAHHLTHTSWIRLTWRQTMADDGGLIGSGLRFVLIAVLTALALNSDYLIVAHTQTVDDVAAYSVVYRVFLALGLLVTVVNLPLWPANADALARGDRRWVMATTRKMILLSGTATLTAGALLVLLSGPIFTALSDGQVDAALPMTLGLTVFYTLLAVASPLFMVQNAAAVLVPQTIGWALYFVTAIPAKVLVSDQLGYEWIPATSVVLYVLLVLPAALVGFTRSTRT